MKCQVVWNSWKSPSRFEYFPIAIDETNDITWIEKLAVFIKYSDSKYNVYKELIELIPMYGTTSKDIMEKVEHVLQEHDFDLSKLVCLRTNGAANMVGRHSGVAAK